MAVRISQTDSEAVITDIEAAAERVSQSFVEVPLEVLDANVVRISQNFIEILVARAVSTPCYPVYPSSRGSVSPRYYATLRDQSGTKVALFDDWQNLEFGRTLDGLDYYTLTIRGDDERRSLFELDGLFEIYRSVPDLSVKWYREFVGLHRAKAAATAENGATVFQSKGIGLNDLLGRTTVLYKAESAQTDKNMVSETAMKEYVNENCGPLATTANGRLLAGVLPHFQVETDRGEGPLWLGSRAFENLLDVLRDISGYSEIDFNVECIGYPQFEFRTYLNQLGRDLTVGNPGHLQPVQFSTTLGNVSSDSYEYDRLNEINTFTLVGGGGGAARITMSAQDNEAIDDSPWNRREACRSGGSQDLSEMAIQALEELAIAKAKEKLSFVPIQQPSCLYGLHYTLGDRITLIHDGVYYNKRLMQMKCTVADHRETLSFEFGDVIPR